MVSGHLESSPGGTFLPDFIPPCGLRVVIPGERFPLGCVCTWQVAQEFLNCKVAALRMQPGSRAQ